MFDLLFSIQTSHFNFFLNFCQNISHNNYFFERREVFSEMNNMLSNKRVTLNKGMKSKDYFIKIVLSKIFYLIKSFSTLYFLYY